MIGEPITEKVEPITPVEEIKEKDRDKVLNELAERATEIDGETAEQVIDRVSEKQDIKPRAKPVGIVEEQVAELQVAADKVITSSSLAEAKEFLKTV